MGFCCSKPATDPETEEGFEAAPEDEQLRTALEGLALKDADGAACTYVSHRTLEPHRREVMASAFPACAGAGRVVAVVGKSPGGGAREFTAVIQGQQQPPCLITGSCQITYEDLVPSECIEYHFAEESSWAMAQLSLEALEAYRGMKFEAWKQMLLKPTCEAQFRRMLQLGMVTRLYDPQVFPTPDALKDKYKVMDERTGKLIELPHPVKELRVWDAAAGAYRAVDPRLGGAPAEADAAAWWEDLLGRLRAEHGEEYISSLAAGR